VVKVQLPKVEESTRKQLNLLKVNAGFKTLDETINHTIDEAEKVPELEKRIKELEDENSELKSDIINIQLGRSTLKEFKEDMKGKETNVLIEIEEIRKLKGE